MRPSKSKRRRKEFLQAKFKTSLMPQWWIRSKKPRKIAISLVKTVTVVAERWSLINKMPKLSSIEKLMKKHSSLNSLLKQTKSKETLSSTKEWVNVNKMTFRWDKELRWLWKRREEFKTKRPSKSVEQVFRRSRLSERARMNSRDSKPKKLLSKRRWRNELSTSRLPQAWSIYCWT